MSLINVSDGIPSLQKRLHWIGIGLVKEAAELPVPSYSMSGLLQANSSKNWIFLSVPNALIRGAFQALDEPGVELPPSGPDGLLNAHISVMRPEELDMIGGIDKITERGKRFRYKIGSLVTVTPGGWPEMSKCWMFRIHSPELQALRRSYGLTSLPNDGKFDFHTTVAVRRKNVLGRNVNRKGTDQ